MKSREHISYTIIDLFFLLFSFYLPYLVRYNYPQMQRLLALPISRIAPNLWLPYLAPYTLIYLFWGMTLLLLLRNYNLFSTARELSYLDEAFLIFKAIILSTLPAAAAVFFLQIKFYSRLVFAANALSLFLFLAAWRMVKRYLVRREVARGYNNIRVLIVGAGKVGKALRREIAARPYLGREIVGYLDDYKEGGDEGCGILGTLSNFESVARQQFVDEVLVTIPSERRKVAELIQKSQVLQVGIRVVPDLLELSAEEVKAGSIGAIPLLEYHSHHPHGTDLAIKRIFDLLASAAALLILLPFLPVIALLIKLDNPGPVFYVSRRCGKNGRIFNFYKFRSMVKDAEKMLEKLRERNEMDGPIFKIRDDPRLTRTGRWLRRFSLDELPQFFNVLKGDMSLVGPRPPTPEEVKKYYDWQLKRLEIRPGITCLWQIKGRSDLSFSEWMKWDFFYIENWSFWLDLKILLRTLLVVIRGHGAY